MVDSNIGNKEAGDRASVSAQRSAETEGQYSRQFVAEFRDSSIND